MIAPTRRAALAGLLAAPLAIRAGAEPPADAAVDRLLDRAAALAPARGLALLAPIDVAALDVRARLDVVTARAGLACDAALARIAMPGRSPYRIGPRAGAWQRAIDPDTIDAERVAVTTDAERGVLLPRAVLDSTIAAMRARTAPPATSAALARFAAALEAWRGRAPSPGMLHLPNGTGWYALLLRRHGVALSPADTDRQLAREEARLIARATALFAGLGDRSGSLGDRYRRLWRDPRHLYADDATGRAQAIADMNQVLAAIRTALPAAIPDLPAWTFDVAVRGMSAAEAAAGLQGFRTLPTPGAPGGYVVDLRRIAARPRWTLPSVVAHELLPGHMLQLPLEAFAPPHRLRLDYAIGFPEGWAAGAEEMAAQYDWLGDDPQVLLGHCHWLLFRIARARADLAIHWRGTPVAAVQRRLESLLGEPVYFIDIATDVARILTEPGTRVAEATSWLAIRRMLAARTADSLADMLAAGRRRDDAIPDRRGIAPGRSGSATAAVARSSVAG